MKTTKLLSLIIATLVGVSQSAWAGHGGGGGFGGGGHFSGGFGGSHFGGFGGGQFAPGHFGGFRGGGFRSAPVPSGSAAHFADRNFSESSRAPQFYYGPAARPAVKLDRPAGSLNRSLPSYAGRATARQQYRGGSVTRQNLRVSNSQASAGAVRHAIANHHVFARHDGNWHRDWDKRRAHFDHGHVFIFVDGFWWGLYPWDYYPYDAYGYPYDYYYGAPHDYYNYYDDYPDNSYDESSYPGSSQGGNGIVSSVQSKLANLGYYKGSIDGVLGDETEAVIARYQEDHDLSVTGTVTAALLHALGLG